jgi:hypothetical protein
MNAQMTALQSQVRTDDLLRAAASERRMPASRPPRRPWRYVLAGRMPSSRSSSNRVAAPSA